MIFDETRLAGAYIIEPEKIEDERGFFARLWCQQEFKARGLNPHLVQISISFNRKAGILRGMHYQVAPYEEAKLVRCTSGAVHDVIVDLRPGSATYKQHVAVELSAENRRMLYIPKGIAHGFQVLRDRTEVLYHMSDSYVPEAARGVRWDDPVFDIDWPVVEHRMMSDRDATWPDFSG